MNVLNSIKSLFYNKKDDLTMVHGEVFYIDKLDSLGLKSNSVFEPEETSLCLKLIKKGDVCIDIGANIGYYSVMFSKLVDNNGMVLCFEPDSENYRLLKKNCQKYIKQGTTKVYKVALSDKKNELPLYKSKDNHGMHRLYESVCCTSEHEIVSVNVGDSFDIDDVNFIKIDIEGYELSAIRGFRNTIKRSEDIKILTEFSPLSIREAGLSVVEYIDFLLNHKLYPIELIDGEWLASDISKLKNDAIIADGIDINQIVSESKSKSNEQIFNIALNELSVNSYTRPVLENLLWVKEKDIHHTIEIINS